MSTTTTSTEAAPPTGNLVVDTWDIVKQIPNYEIVAGGILFRRVFDMAPGVHKLFKFGAEYEYGTPEFDKIYEQPAILAHYRSVIGTVDAAVQLVRSGDIATLVSILNKLGRKHYYYGVREAHFPVVGEALLYTLEAALGVTVFTDETKKAWTDVYGIITTNMLEGGNAVEKEQAEKNHVQ